MSGKIMGSKMMPREFYQQTKDRQTERERERERERVSLVLSPWKKCEDSTVEKLPNINSTFMVKVNLWKVEMHGGLPGGFLQKLKSLLLNTQEEAISRCGYFQRCTTCCVKHGRKRGTRSSELSGSIASLCDMNRLGSMSPLILI